MQILEAVSRLMQQIGGRASSANVTSTMTMAIVEYTVKGESQDVWKVTGTREDRIYSDKHRDSTIDSGS